MPIATPAAAFAFPCPDFTLPDVFGVSRRRDDVVGGKAALVVFFCNHCPYARAVEDRLIALHKEMAPFGLTTTLIAANDWLAYPDDSPENLQKRALEKGYPVPYLVDEHQRSARAFGAVCTPDFFLFDARQKLSYRGRIDDNWKHPELVQQRELALAIRALALGEAVPSVQHPALGCSIKWKVDA